MGLDVYMYRYSKPLEEAERLRLEGEAAYEAAAAEALKSMGVATFEELNAHQYGDYYGTKERLLRERGFDKYGEPPGVTEKVERDSALYPKHYFKVGYFRSSYNDGGINRVLSRFGCDRLDAIFPAEGEVYRRVVDWKASRDRAVATLAALRAALAEQGPYDCHRVATFLGSPDAPK